MPTARGSTVAHDGPRLTLTVADHNRARWARVALAADSALTRSLLEQGRAQSGRVLLIDSISLLRSGVGPPAGAHVLLWDGFNSYRELRQAMPAVAERHDLHFAVVGWLADLTPFYPTAPLPAFEEVHRSPSGDGEGGFRFAAWVSRLSSLRTRLRSSKNALADRARHRVLSGEPKLVFCGLVRPPHEVVGSLSRAAADDALSVELLAIGDGPLLQTDAKRSERVRRAYQLIRERDRDAPEAVASSFSMLAVLHRFQTLSRLAAMCDAHLFVSEYGRDRHFDPYDSPDYRQHLYLDFGSTRGVERRYPRTVDLALHSKQCVPLRLLGLHEQLSEFLDRTEPNDFLGQCELHAQQASKLLSAPSPHSALRPGLEPP